MSDSKRVWASQATAECVECGRVFRLLDEDEANEWFYGHDCESED